MKNKLFLLVPVMIVLQGFSQAEKVSITTPEKQKGVCYFCWWGQDCYSQVDSDISLAHLAETGADWISLYVDWHQENFKSTQISAGQSDAADAALEHVLGQAHAMGLKVMLRPSLALSDDPTHVPAEIGQGFTTESEWTAWFASYRTFIEHYADFAAAHGVEEFCVGHELLGTTHRTSDWRAVVAGIRSRYAGPLIYACNHSAVESLTWWDALDFIGVEAYYPLATMPNPPLQELRAAWQPIVSTLESLSARWRKPILFTEIGYRSTGGTAKHPAWQFEGELDFKEQADCYEAAFESLYKQPWFAGMYWWSWSPNPEEGGQDDSGYSPHDKPAEEILKKWFGGSPSHAPNWIIEPNPDRKIEIISEGLSPGWEDRSWGAERDYRASDEFHQGGLSLRARLDPEGAISVWHAPIHPYMYYFLEFYVRGSEGDEPNFWVYFDDPKGQPLFKTPVNDPRYLDGGHIQAGTWSRVFIPLVDMGVGHLPLQRFSIQDRSGKGTTVFWVDDLRIIGANWQKEPSPPAKEPTPRQGFRRTAQQPANAKARKRD